MVFEGDGSSHSRGDAQRRDVVKDDWLDSRGVKCVRMHACRTQSDYTLVLRLKVDRGMAS